MNTATEEDKSRSMCTVMVEEIDPPDEGLVPFDMIISTTENFVETPAGINLPPILLLIDELEKAVKSGKESW